MRTHGLNAEAVHRHLVDQLRSRARKRGFSIEGLADASGISRSQIWRILAGQSSPSLETIAALSRTLRCRPRDLLP